MAKPKPVKKAARAPAKKAGASVPAAPKLQVAKGELSVTAVPGPDGLEPLLGTAYLLTDRAYVRLGGTSKALVVRLAPKGARDAKALEALKETFAAELESQRLRWAIARNSRAVREHVAENALALAAEYESRPKAPAPGAVPEAAPDQLTTEQKAEIERLIAEVEAEIQQMNTEQKLPDPKGATASWEAANEKGGSAP